jgi:hypothetical protein
MIVGTILAYSDDFIELCAHWISRLTRTRRRKILGIALILLTAILVCAFVGAELISYLFFGPVRDAANAACKIKPGMTQQQFISVFPTDFSHVTLSVPLRTWSCQTSTGEILAPEKSGYEKRPAPPFEACETYVPSFAIEEQTSDDSFLLKMYSQPSASDPIQVTKYYAF